MRFLLLLTLLFAFIWCAAAVSSPQITHVARQQNNSPTKTRTQSATRTGAKHTATATKAGKKKQSGLTKAAKIGIGVGVPLGVIAIVGAITAYIIGKRRGRKRRVDDPNAGAGKFVKDPSAELNLPPPTPTAPPVAELPTVRSDDFTKEQRPVGGGQWWNPFGRKDSTKAGYTVPPNAPQSPQEMPA